MSTENNNFENNHSEDIEMKYFKNAKNSATKTRRRGVLGWFWGLLRAFSTPQITPVNTKSEKSTIELVMSTREINRVTQKIVKAALSRQ